MRSEETGSTHRPPVRTLAVIRFVVTWYLAIFWALFACMSGRWEVVLAAAGVGAGLDLLRRRPLRAMFAARAAGGGWGPWTFRSAAVRPWVAGGIVFTVAYWGFVIWRVSAQGAGLPDWAMAALDLLWDASEVVEQVAAMGYPRQAAQLGVFYLACTVFVVVSVNILVQCLHLWGHVDAGVMTKSYDPQVLKYYIFTGVYVMMTLLTAVLIYNPWLGYYHIAPELYPDVFFDRVYVRITFFSFCITFLISSFYWGSLVLHAYWVR